MKYHNLLTSFHSVNTHPLYIFIDFFFIHLQVVAVKQLDRNGLQGNREFLCEVLMLSNLQHPNLVHLIGYCSDGDQRILVYEFMSSGTLEDHLLGMCLHFLLRAW